MTLKKVESTWREYMQHTCNGMPWNTVLTKIMDKIGEIDERLKKIEEELSKEPEPYQITKESQRPGKGALGKDCDCALCQLEINPNFGR